MVTPLQFQILLTQSTLCKKMASMITGTPVMIELWVVALTHMSPTKMDMVCSMELQYLRMVALVMLEQMIMQKMVGEVHQTSKLKIGGNTTE